MIDKQTASNIWENEKGICKLNIELSGELELSDVYMQFKGLLEGVGYDTKEMDE